MTEGRVVPLKIQDAVPIKAMQVHVLEKMETKEPSEQLGVSTRSVHGSLQIAILRCPLGHGVLANLARDDVHPCGALCG